MRSWSDVKLDCIMVGADIFWSPWILDLQQTSFLV